MAATKLTLKMLVNKATNTVLFAEAGKDFVDFLFSLLAIPIGTVVQLLTAPSMVGSVGNIYASLDSMAAAYLKPSMNKDLLLKPKITPGDTSDLLRLEAPPEPKPDEQKTSYYRCSDNYSNGCFQFFTDIYNTDCPGCRRYKMTREAKLVPERSQKTVNVQVPPASNAVGYAQEIVTYMVMDDLSVSPMSTISSITLLNRCNIHNLGCLEERTVNVETEQGLLLLKTALQSKTVLTDVFLKAKAAAVPKSEKD